MSDYGSVILPIKKESSLEIDTQLLTYIKQKKILYKQLQPDTTFEKNAPLFEKDRLLGNHRISQLIREPIQYGKFYDDEHYLKTLELLFASTKETQHRKKFFQTIVLPRLTNRNNLLEIGVGNGEITKVFCKEFKNVTLVDINENALHSLDNILSQNNMNIIKIYRSILDVNLSYLQYELSVLSHVLYYIDQSHWIPLIQKIYRSTKTKGIVVIVLSGGLDKFNLGKYFNGSPIDLDKIVIDCEKKLDSKIEVYDIEETCFASDISAALHIAGIYINDAKTVAEKQQLINFLERNNRNRDNIFNFRFVQRFILLEKT